MRYDRIDIIRQDWGVGPSCTLLGVLPGKTDLLGFASTPKKAREMASKRTDVVVDYSVSNDIAIGEIITGGNAVPFTALCVEGVAEISGDRFDIPKGSTIYEAVGLYCARRLA